MRVKSDELQTRVAKECYLLYDGAESACWACGPGWDGPLEKMNGKFYEGDKEIPSPFKSKSH